MLSLYKKNTFFIGKWEVDPLHNTIRQGSEKFDIEPKAMQVLEYLARYAGQTVHRDALFKAFWPNQIVTEEALTRVISHLRHCLADLPKSPRYIVTVRKTGYRLIANVSSGDYFASYPSSNVSSAAQPSSSAVKFLNLLTKSATFSIATLLIYLIFNQPTVSGISTPKVRYITSELGEEMSPALSPDGLNVAYTKYVKDGDDSLTNKYIRGFILKNIANNKTELIDMPDGYSSHPAWAPDNIHVALANEVEISEKETRYRIYIKNILSGDLQFLVETSTHNHGLTWSPDGKHIVYPDGPQQNKSKELYSINVKTGERKLLLPLGSQHHAVYCYPKYSPNGKYIAVIRTDQGAYDNIDLYDTQTNTVKNILHTEPDITTLEWKDDKTLFIISGSAGSSQLIELSIDNGKMNYIDIEDNTIEYLSYSRKTERLIFESINRPHNIFVSNYAAQSNYPKDFVPYTQSNKQELEAVERPDGLYTAIISTRSGAFEIWLRNNLDQQSQKLTTLNADSINGMDWSPDQNRISFIATINHKQAVYWYNIKKHRLRTFSHGNSDYSLIGWQDDQTLLFSSNYNDQWQLWRYHTDTKDLALVSGKPIVDGRLSPDRKTLYFVRYKEPGIWKSAINENSAVQVPGTEDISVFRSWTVSDRGIFYFQYGNLGKREELYFLDFETSKTVLSAWVWGVYLNRIYWSNNKLYYSLFERRESDIALIENFN